MLSPIKNEIELIATQDRIDSILDKKEISQDDKNYLKVIGTLVYDYEQEHETMPVIQGVELPKALMDKENLQPSDLIYIFNDESTVTKVLEKKQ
jgi:HTH-type transcriptional regulator/antitoxin HigA